MDVKKWLIDKKVCAAAYDCDELLSDFLDEMEFGLASDSGSLPMIPAYIGVQKAVSVGKPVAVIDAGGTNLRVSLVSFDEKGEVTLSNFSKQAMPGRDFEQSAAEFYAVLVDALAPFIDEFEQIGFCFSYPALITEDLDGELIYWSKEIKIPELVGKRVGAGLQEALKSRGLPEKRVVMLNDTVACLLAGLAEGQQFEASSYIGFILGTGTNTAYCEKSANIKKIAASNGVQVINMESGGFSRFHRNKYDRCVDEASENPGCHFFEKSISGVYMGALTLELLQELAEEGAFSKAGVKELSTIDELSTIHIDNLCAENGRAIGPLESDQFSTVDLDVMRAVFSAVVDRAALLVAVNLCAVVIKSDAGKEAAHPVCINIDGSTYYKTYQMPQKVQAYLKKLLDPRGLHVRCVQVEDAPIVGAAIAGLSAK